MSQETHVTVQIFEISSKLVCDNFCFVMQINSF